MSENGSRGELSAAKQALLEQLLAGKRPATASGAAQPEAAEEIRKSSGSPTRLSFAQERIWFNTRLNPESKAYHMYEAVRLRGPLDEAALQAALQALVDRHAILRTTFVAQQGEPQAVIAGHAAADLRICDLRALPASEREESLARTLAEEAGQPFDLETGPLWRFTLVRLADEEQALLFTLHHILSDEWSNRLLWEELAQGYQAARAGEAVTQASPPTLEYTDFADWQRGRMARGEFDPQMEYWLERLKGPLPALQLPTDRPRPAVQSFRGALAFDQLTAEVSDELRRLGQGQGATLFMLLLAAFKTLLLRYSGQEQVVVGAPVSNRSRAELEDMPGIFLNTLALRTDMSGDPTFRELLGRVRQGALEAFSHAELPFEKLVDRLQPERNLSRHPIFQVMHVHQENQRAAFAVDGLESQTLWIDAGVSKFDLTLFTVETPQGVELALEYSTDLFAEAVIQAMLRAFKTLCASLAAQPEARLSELPLLTPAEKQHILFGWNATQAGYPQQATIHSLIEVWSQRDPTRPALFYQGRSLSYGELEARANRLAHALRAAGVGQGSLVGLCLPRSFELFTGMLAILKAGAAYAPLDPAYPVERLDFILAETAAPVILTTGELKDTLSARLGRPSVRLISLDGDWSDLSGFPDSPPEPLIAPEEQAEQLAYVIYTSGSTGNPKGVPVTHRNLLHSTWARLQYYSPPVERFLLLSSAAFDSSVAGIYGTLCSGGALVLPETGQEAEAHSVLRLIETHHVDGLLCLPSLYRLLLEFSSPSQLQSLHTSIVAGESCHPALVDLHSRRVPHADLYNEYGPSEGTVWCSVYQAYPAQARPVIPIGKPIANMALYVLDHRLEPVPPGATGELYISGEGLVSGYYRRPDLTAERFIEHAWEPGPPVRLYRTGDLARALPDGNIVFLGRADQQVKIRGFRVELEEIENVLRLHPGVQEAAVVVWNEAPELSSAASLAAALEKMPPETAERLLTLAERWPAQLPVQDGAERRQIDA